MVAFLVYGVYRLQGSIITMYEQITGKTVSKGAKFEEAAPIGDGSYSPMPVTEAKSDEERKVKSELPFKDYRMGQNYEKDGDDDYLFEKSEVQKIYAGRNKKRRTDISTCALRS